MMGLTPRQKDLFDFLRTYIANQEGVAPTMEEIRVELKLASKSGVVRLLRGLEERGLIRRIPYLDRAIEILAVPPRAGFDGAARAIVDMVIARICAGHPLTPAGRDELARDARKLLP